MVGDWRAALMTTPATPAAPNTPAAAALRLESVGGEIGNTADQRRAHEVGEWIVDSGATNHMSGNLELFSKFSVLDKVPLATQRLQPVPVDASPSWTAPAIEQDDVGPIQFGTILRRSTRARVQPAWMEDFVCANATPCASPSPVVLSADHISCLANASDLREPQRLVAAIGALVLAILALFWYCIGAFVVAEVVHLPCCSTSLSPPGLCKVSHIALS
ncbi:hypothetical protein Salat_1916000 [Sesamum alatum]|uniref:Retrovirus-related Pol polyprotein from transposon TNT 1-94-like beta-barrel domain-containing protein n=1 Tax=Sesamum alatum TaxID=300844 RepID=A0AAE2CIF9_9LAMI|nr:hypothetical protein Salat_1916000 [Sesamum alatum]